MIAIIIGLSPALVVGVVLYVFFTQKNRPYALEQQYVRKPALIMWVLGAIVLMLNIFAYDVVAGIGVGVFFASIVLSVFFLMKKEQRTLLSYIILLVGIAAAVSIGVRANGFVQIIDAITVGISIGLLSFIGSLEKITWDGIVLIRNGFDYSKRLFFNLPLIVSLQEDGVQKSRVVSILKTTILALIAFFIFVELLSAADPVFAQIVRELKEQAFGRFVLSLFVIIPIYVFNTVWIPLKPQDQRDPLKSLSVQDLYVPMLVIVGLVGVFIFVQIKYLFGGHESLADFGYTYSEYVRKGFVELIIASAIGGIISYVVYLKSRLLTDLRQKTSLVAVNILMITELFMLLLSALKRDLLYVEVYGLTRTRVIGGAFLVWLAGLFIMLLILTLEKKAKERLFFIVMGILTVVFVGFINIVNIDHFIVSYSKPSDYHNESDYYYVNILSEDARQGWRDSITYVSNAWDTLSQKDKLTEDQLKEFTNLKLSMVALLEKREALDVKYGSEQEAKNILGYLAHEDLPTSIIQKRRFQSYNLSEYMAYRMMQDDKELFYTKLNCMVSDIFNYQITNKFNNYSNEGNVLFETDRPFVMNSLKYAPTSSFDSLDGVFNSRGFRDVEVNLGNYLMEHHIPLQCK